MKVREREKEGGSRREGGERREKISKRFEIRYYYYRLSCFISKREKDARVGGKLYIELAQVRIIDDAEIADNEIINVTL